MDTMIQYQQGYMGYMSYMINIGYNTWACWLYGIVELHGINGQYGYCGIQIYWILVAR